MATTGYKIGYEGSDVTISSQKEAQWGVNPDGAAGTFDSMRLTSFTPGYDRTRTRPNEIRSDKQQPKGVTTQVSAGPSITAPMTKTAWSEIWAASINGDISGGTAQNGTVFQSFTLLQQLSATESRVYAGSWPSGGNLEIQQGQMLQIGFDFLSAGLIGSGAPTDTVAPVNTFDIMDPIASVTKLKWNGADLAGVTGVTMTWSKQDAAALYVLGSADAAGIAMGALMVEASTTLYFNDSTLFDAMIAETEGQFELSIRDGTDGYDILLPATTIVSHDDPVNGSGPFTATVNFEAAPGPGGFTMSLAAVSA